MKNLFEKITDAFKSIGLALGLGAAALTSALTPLTSSAQGVPPSGQYVVNAITLPFASLPAASAGSTTTTNLGNGWSSIVTNILISTTWNSSSNAFISTTNTTYNTNTTYADIPLALQKDVAVAMSFVSPGSSANAVYTFAPFLDSGTVDSINTILVTNAANGTNIYSGYAATLSTNLNRNLIGGDGGVRLLSVTWYGTNGIGFTNNFLKYAIKRGIQ